MRFIFKNPEEIVDERSLFVNNVCKLIYNSVELVSERPKDFNILFEKIEIFLHGFEQNIYNFYELIETEIPLVALYNLRDKTEAMENYGLTEQQYSDSYQQSIYCCILYYRQSNNLINI